MWSVFLASEQSQCEDCCLITNVTISPVVRLCSKLKACCAHTFSIYHNFVVFGCILIDDAVVFFFVKLMCMLIWYDLSFFSVYLAFLAHLIEWL